jgi:CheY-like chemotaxis protein/DNA-binding XRE family transcriptional regulator
MDIEKEFGTAVKVWRDKVGLSQEELANRAGFHRSYICDIERGARNVSLKNVQKLSNALSIPISTLFSDLNIKSSAEPLTLDQQVDILVVEDDVNDAMLTELAFRKWGLKNRLYLVHDGVAALDFLLGTGSFAHRNPADQPQVILLDLHLPKVSGLEVLRRIKADPRTRSIPVIALSGSKDSADITECRRLGVENYILKPVDFQSFSEVSLRLNLQWILMKPVSAPSPSPSPASFSAPADSGLSDGSASPM